MRRLATIGLVSATLIAGTLAAAPASLADAVMPKPINVNGSVPGAGGYGYPLTADAPAGLAPGLTVVMTASPMTGATGDYIVSQTLRYGYVPDDTTCRGSGINEESVNASALILKTYTLPETINGVAPSPGEYFCVQRFATGVGNANQGNIYRSDPVFIPIGQASSASVTAPFIFPPAGRDFVYPGEAFTVLFPLVQNLKSVEAVQRRELEYGRASSVGGACSLQGNNSLQANAQVQLITFTTDVTSGYLCVRQKAEVNLYPPRVISEYRYVKVQRPITQIENPNNDGGAGGVSIVEARPNVPVLSGVNGAALEGKVGEAYRIEATVSGSAVNNSLLERSVYTGYSPNSTSCDNATRTEQENANTQPFVIEATFEEGRAGQFFCAYQNLNVSGVTYLSNVIYQEIVAAEAPAAPEGPKVGPPPDAPNAPVPPGAGEVAPGPTKGPRLFAGDVLELTAPATSTRTGSGTIRLRTKASAKRGKATRVRVTVQPVGSGGSVDYYLTTPRKTARVLAVLGSTEVNATGVASQRMVIPAKGTKKGKRYYVVAEYTSPQGDVAQVVRKIRLR